MHVTSSSCSKPTLTPSESASAICSLSEPKPALPGLFVVLGGLGHLGSCLMTHGVVSLVTCEVQDLFSRSSAFECEPTVSGAHHSLGGEGAVKSVLRLFVLDRSILVVKGLQVWKLITEGYYKLFRPQPSKQGIGEGAHAIENLGRGLQSSRSSAGHSPFQSPPPEGTLISRNLEHDCAMWFRH